MGIPARLGALLAMAGSLVCSACAPPPPPGGPPSGATAAPPARSSDGARARTQSAPADRRLRPAPPAAARDGEEPGAMASILAAHNRLRADHCAPPLAWSRELAAYAQDWADELADAQCAFEHRPRSAYGENLAFFGPAGSMTGADVAAMWHAEVEDYDFSSPGFSMKTGHFTQLVWRQTRRLGCGVSRCGGGELWVCNYDPPGNVERGYRANVRPTDCR